MGSFEEDVLMCDVCRVRQKKCPCVCGQRAYCSKRCQGLDWEEHSQVCASRRVTRAVGVCLGDRVRIVKLEKAASYNWREGVAVEKGDRWKVQLAYSRKTLLVREENLIPVRRCASPTCGLPGASLPCATLGCSFYCSERCRYDDIKRHQCRREDADSKSPRALIEKAFREYAEANEALCLPLSDSKGPNIDRLRFLKRVDQLVCDNPQLLTRNGDKASVLETQCEFRKLEVTPEISNFPSKGPGIQKCPVCQEYADDAGRGRGLCFECGQSVCAKCAVDMELSGQRRHKQCPACFHAPFAPLSDSELDLVKRMQRLSKLQGKHLKSVLKCLGDVYLQGCDELEPDADMAKRYYEKAFEQNSKEAAVMLGKIAWRESDLGTAMKWFERAGEDYGPARVQLAKLYVESKYTLHTKDATIQILKSALRDSNEPGAFDTLRKMGVQTVGILVDS